MEPVYILGGPEIGRRNDFIKQIKASAINTWKSEPEEYKLYSTDCSVAKLIETLLDGLLFSSYKIVYYMGAGEIKAKADINMLTEYITHPSKNSILFLISDTYGVDKAIENIVSKNAKKIFWELSQDETRQWLVSSFSAYGINADATAVEAMLNLVDNNTEALRLEVSRLAMFFSSGALITENDIDMYIAHNRSEDSFTLFDKMVQGSFSQALDCLLAILSEKSASAVSIISGLIWSFRRLSNLHEALSKGQNFDEAARNLRITRKQALTIHRLAIKKWPLFLCRELTAFAIDIDSKIRLMGPNAEKTLLELFLYAAIIKQKPLDISDTSF